MTEAVQLDAKLLAELERLQSEIGGTTEALVSELLSEALSARRAAIGEWSQFASRLAHELRTPLASLSMMIELLGTNGSDRLDGSDRRYLRYMERSAADLSRIIDGFHTLARIEGGREPVRSCETTVAEVLADLERDTAPAARSKGIALSLSASNTEDDGVFQVDRSHLLAIVGTLVHNAIRISDTGEVSVTAARQSDGTVTFSVSDTGPTISERDLASLFVPFDRAGPRSSREHGGSGLEHVVAAARARLIGGLLSVEREGEATRFRLFLPPDPTFGDRSPQGREGSGSS